MYDVVSEHSAQTRLLEETHNRTTRAGHALIF